ncbi:MAG: hypothetical protein FD155_3098 [Bacteroidetes bacterium]|nr:MAG: hypothetical protein FD155_3098 [Bacteroidota bacterium]
MRTLIISFLLMTAIVSVAQQTEQDREAIRRVIQESYVQGIHNKAGIELVEKGFHPGFEMLGVQDGLLTRYPIYSWIETLKKTMGQTPASEITSEIPFVDVAGDAAVARVELFKEGKHLFTDYMSLYRFQEGWKIVAKIYYRIPEK